MPGLSLSILVHVMAQIWMQIWWCPAVVGTPFTSDSSPWPWQAGLGGHVAGQRTGVKVQPALHALLVPSGGQQHDKE